ncbi:MAG: biopolymer transporter ExbD [Deltaproteobacteria bacterium]|nr:biopolymer transporter ExbD [Deltaproteobacteria bacterium]
MGWNLKRDEGRLMSEINITPLTDVMLVLLVIFMVTTPLIMIESFKVKLPKAVSAGAEPGKGVVIEIGEGGNISINGKASSRVEPSQRAALYDAIKSALANSPEKTVVIKADTNVRHGLVVEVLDTAKLAGAAKLSIAVERKKKQTGTPSTTFRR